MSNVWPFRGAPPLALWLWGIGGVVIFGGMLFLHGWYVYITQGVTFILWGMALIMTAITLQRREQQSALYTQPQFWFGLLFLAALPDAIVLLLQQSHALPEGIIGAGIILASVIACLSCLVLGYTSRGGNGTGWPALFDACDRTKFEFTSEIRSQLQSCPQSAG